MVESGEIVVVEADGVTILDGDEVIARESSVVDWDEVIADMAADVFCGHWDSYTATRNNFTFHLDDAWRLPPLVTGTSVLMPAAIASQTLAVDPSSRGAAALLHVSIP